MTTRTETDDQRRDRYIGYAIRRIEKARKQQARLGAGTVEHRLARSSQIHELRVFVDAVAGRKNIAPLRARTKLELARWLIARLSE